MSLSPSVSAKQKMSIFWPSLLLFFQLLHCCLCPAAALPQGNDDDASALMDFKRGCVVTDPDHLLTSWGTTATTPSPCSWWGVTCSSNGRVTGLNIANAGLVGRLNLTFILALPHLRHLNLHGNSFSDIGIGSNSSRDLWDEITPARDPCYLETLDLSSNNLSNLLGRDFQQILLSCNHLSSLNLSHNSIVNGSALLDHFGPSLSHLDLSHNLISDSSSLIRALSNCRNLEFFSLSNNKLSGRIMPHDGSPFSHQSSSCEKLSALDLSHNHLRGRKFPRLLLQLSPSFEHVDLSHNNFSVNFSSVEFKECRRLMFLNLSYNSFSGPEFPTSLINCKLLHTLDLSHNNLGHTIPGLLLGNLKRLRWLSLAGNHFLAEIPCQLGWTCRTLEYLDLSENKLVGGLPASFKSCSSLQSLNLGKNMVSGDFLDTVVSNLPNLRHLYVPFNNITGPIPLSLKNCTALRVLDLSSNAFVGNISPGFCSSCTATEPALSSSLEELLLPDNLLSGKVPLELANCVSLTTIDLSLNKLSGRIPLQLWTLPRLSNVVMWGNYLSGDIPQGICNIGGNLETLILNNNFLTGRIPRSLSNCSNLVWLSLSSNRLTGGIPPDFGKLQNLTNLQLCNNMLGGHIPRELKKCRSLVWLDLSSNNLTGPIPEEIGNEAGFNPGLVSDKKFAFLSGTGKLACRGTGGLVEFQGIRAETLARLPMASSCPSVRVYVNQMIFTAPRNTSMVYLDLSNNSLSGSIPESIGSMKMLSVLGLSRNKLTGRIPDNLGSMVMAAVLDLSHNNLQGSIPGSLQNLGFLSHFDVSNNNLSGPIPGGQLTTFPSSVFEKNSGLCGLPMPPCASSVAPRSSSLPPPVWVNECDDAKKRHSKSTSDNNEIEWGGVGVGYGCGAVVGLVIGECMVRRRWHQWYKVPPPNKTRTGKAGAISSS